MEPQGLPYRLCWAASPVVRAAVCRTSCAQPGDVL
jgi:hypothetical protein